VFEGCEDRTWRFSVGEGGDVTGSEGSRSLLASSSMPVYVPNDAFDLGMLKGFSGGAFKEQVAEQFEKVRTGRARSD
jgi:hypothetical protein